MASDLNSLDDILLQPATKTVRAVGKFRPKPKSKLKNDYSTSLNYAPLLQKLKLVVIVEMPKDRLLNYPRRNLMMAFFSSSLLVVPSDTSGLGSLDDILLQPIKTTVRVGKFQPRPKAPTTASKSSAPVIIHDAAVAVPSPPPAITSKDAGCVSPPYDPQLPSLIEGLGDRSPLSNAPTSVSSDPLTFNTCSSAPFDPSSQLLVAQEAEDLIDVEHSKAAVSDANEKLQMNDEKLRKQAPNMTSGLDSFDVLFHPTKTTVRRVGKFRPKPKATTTASKSFTHVPPDDVVPVPSLTPTTTSKATEFISPPFDPQLLSSQIEELGDEFPLSNTPNSTCIYAPVDPSSQLLVGQEAADLTDAEHSTAAVSDAIEKLQMDHENSVMKVPTVSSGLDSLDDIPFQPTTTTELLPCDSTPTDLYSQILTQQSSNLSETPYSEAAVPGGDGYLQSVRKTSRRESTKGRKRKALTEFEKTVDKSSTIGDENEASNGAMQLRKRKAVLSPVNEIDDGTMETSNNSTADVVNESDHDYNGEDTAKGRKAPRGTKRPATETDKPSRRRKKASDKTDPINTQPAKKKFSHSTRRNRRTVSKELLETPDEYIDPKKLTIKDLIILADFKERKLNKEAEALKKSSANQSADNSIPNGDPYDDEDPLASTQGLDPEDDQANHRTETSSGLVNYQSFMDRTPSKRWSKSDTEMFYEAIRQFGTDFAMIQQLFPDRTRHQVKLKYKAEERKHPLQVADALIHRSKDHSHFELVIEQLQQAQVEQNGNRDAELPDAISENEGQGVESEQNEEEVAKEEPEVNSPVKSNASQDDFDWIQYGTADASYPQDIEKDDYALF